MIVFFIMLFTSMVIFLLEAFQSRKKVELKKLTPPFKIAILIPARDESSVIEPLLKSILHQTVPVPAADVYIIVEDKKDPTVSIAQKYHMNIVFRQDLSKKRKGYALDDAVQMILKQQKSYDAYFIFDADNVLDEAYIENMFPSIAAGYDIGIGYRNTKNGNDSVYAACSSLTFSMIHTLGNATRMKHNKTLTISGTGFYILGRHVEDWQGYPFRSLTEDYELTLYATIHDFTTTYVKNAIFYDEQPIDYQTTIVQRTRWVKGYFEARKMYYQDIYEKCLQHDSNFASCFEALMGVKPYILLIIGIVSIFIEQFGKIMFHLTNQLSILPDILSIACFLLLIYFVLFLVSAYIVLHEQKEFRLNTKMKVKVCFYYPLFLASYLVCLKRAMMQKDVSWDPIEHNRNVDLEGRKK